MKTNKNMNTKEFKWIDWCGCNNCAGCNDDCGDSSECITSKKVEVEIEKCLHDEYDMILTQNGYYECGKCGTYGGNC